MKYLISFLLVLTAFVAVSSSAYAGAGVTRIRGNVYNITNGQQGIGGQTVTVNCLGNIKTATTDSFGLYEVEYTRAQCPKFKPVTSTVTYNGQQQTQTVDVADVYRATLDFYYGATGMPEFGAITGAITAIGSGLAFYGLRRKTA